MLILIVAYFIAVILQIVYSFAFVDPNLTLSTYPWYQSFQSILSVFLYSKRMLSGMIFGALLGLFFILYLISLRAVSSDKNKNILLTRLIGIVILLTFSFPAFSYDIFNYILTAKVAFYYHENPYIVMPIEILNEPALAYTRAANKVALYGPTWILFTWLPHVLGIGNVWLTIVSFKLLVAAFYLVAVWLIYRLTKNAWQTAFFALNPLVINEVLVSSHNDVVMMALALSGLVLARKKGLSKKIFGWGFWILSVFVKGVTVVLAPLLLVRWPLEKLTKAAFLILFGVFLLSPFREELYPWYALWFLTFAALIPRERGKFIHGFCIALSLGLELRHLPYILTREYGGSGPMWQLILTAAPVLLFILWRLIRWRPSPTIKICQK